MTPSLPRTGRRSQTGYLVSTGSSVIAFVPAGGYWIRTHPCVMVVACPLCGAVVGEACFGKDYRGRTGDYYCAMTHYHRRRAAKGVESVPRLAAAALDLGALRRGNVAVAAERGRRRKA